MKLWLKRILLVAGILLLAAVPVAADTPCNSPGNVVYNCRLDNFQDRTEGGSIKHIPDGWWFFVLEGDPEMRPSIDTLWGEPSQELWSDGGIFTAGIYQQLKVTPGVVYQSNIGWAAPTKPDFERKLGLDPKGGTDPLAPSVVWGPSSWEVTAMPDLTVSARAEGQTMTVFAWVRHSSSHGMDQVFLDDIGVWPDPNQPAATLTPTPVPTKPPPTRAPATKTPTSVPVTDTPTALPESPTPANTPTLVPSPTMVPPTLTPTATSTFTPSPEPPTSTPTPTLTPSVTPVPVAQLLSKAPPRPEAETLYSKNSNGPSAETILLLISGGAVVLASILVGVAVFIWLGARA